MPESSGLNYYSFDRVAGEYESTRYLPAEIAREAARLLTITLPSDAWFLDAGTGTGRIGRFIAQRHPRTIGLDISGAMLGQMLSYPRPYRLQADLRSLPFSDATFKRILSIHVFHLIRHWQTALAEIWRVLSPGGIFYIGREERSQTAVREHYLQHAEEAGVLMPRIGTRLSAVLETLEAWGGIAHPWQPATLQWEQQRTIRETLSMLERRTYSILWEVPDEVHLRILRKTTDWAIATFGSLDFVETSANQLLLSVVQKPE